MAAAFGGTKQELRDIRSKRSVCDDTNKSTKLLHALGGINCVLDDYFSEEVGCVLSQTQMNQIHQILFTPTEYKQSADTISADE